MFRTILPLAALACVVGFVLAQQPPPPNPNPNPNPPPAPQPVPQPPGTQPQPPATQPQQPYDNRGTHTQGTLQVRRSKQVIGSRVSISGGTGVGVVDDII